MPLDYTNFPAVDETTALLIRARSFLKRGWCRYTFAQDASAQPVSPASKQAVAWCANGALFAACLSLVDYDWHPAVCRLEDALGGEPIHAFNNRQETVEPVLAAFDRAIAGTPVGRAK